MNDATDLSMGENGGQGNSLKRTHDAAALSSSGEVRRDFFRPAYSDDDLDSCDGSVLGGRPSTPVPKPGKKTRGRVKINMEFIDNKLRRYTTFSKRKSGIMKKAHELATLTGTQVMLLVASETGHVYTFATRKLQPILSSEAGKQLIQTCLNSPDPPESPRTQNSYDQQRMSAQGFEEPDLSYAPPDESKEGLLQKTYHNMMSAISAQGGTSAQEHQSTSSTSVTEIRERATNSPMNLIAVNNTNSSRGVSALQLSTGAFIMSGATHADTRSIQISPDNQTARCSLANSTGVLPHQTLFSQPTIIPERLNDGQIALLSSYGSIPRQVPAMQQVLWTPTALHTQQIAVMHSSSPPDDKKPESKGPRR